MKRFFQSGVLLVASLLVAGAIAEGSVRIFAPHSRDHVVPAGMFDIDPELGWKLHPGSNVRHRTRYFDVPYSINSMGFRDRQRSVEQNDKRRRILVFGDSHIFGWGVTPEQRATGIVEARNPSLDIWNMGVPGYGLDQEVLSYERDGGSFGATDVVLFATWHTATRMMFSQIYRKPKPMFTVDSAGALVPTPVRSRTSARTDLVYRLLSPLYLPYFLELQVRRLGGGRRGRDVTPSLSPEVMRLQMALLLKAKALATERNQRLFLLTILPEESTRELADFCNRNGIVLLETPWSQLPIELTFGPGDAHLVPRAHELMADRLSAQLAQ